jgi:hypothetical protein
MTGDTLPLLDRKLQGHCLFGLRTSSCTIIVLRYACELQTKYIVY